MRADGDPAGEGGNANSEKEKVSLHCGRSAPRLVCTAAGLLDFLGSGPGPGEVAGWLLVVVSRMQPLWDSVRGCWWEGQVTAVERPGSMRLSCLLYTAFPGSPQGGGRGTRPGEKAGRGSHSAAAAPQHRTSCRTGKAPGRAPGGRVVGWSQHKGIRFQQNEENQRPDHGSLGRGPGLRPSQQHSCEVGGCGCQEGPGQCPLGPSTRPFLLENSSATGHCSPIPHLSSGPATQTRSR